MRKLALVLVLLACMTHFVTGSLSCGGRLYKSASPYIWNCCAGTLYPKAANFYACCGSRCYNAITQLCCGNKIYSKLNINTACCGGQKMYQRGESICCGGQVFDQNAYGCCLNVHYLLRTQFCCDRKVIEKKSNLTTNKCCGDRKKTLYDEATDICCNRKVYQKHYGSRTRCCAKKVYDAKQNGCCNGKVIPKTNGADKCCNGFLMNSKTNICCGKKIYPLLYGHRNTGCCRQSLPNSGSFKENLVKGNYVLYDKRNSICCSGKITLKAHLWNNGCCRREAYNVKTHICCNEKIFKRRRDVIARCCNGQPFDRRYHLCCKNSLQKLIPGLSRYLLCCNQVMFDRRKEKCLFGSVIPLQCKKTV